MMPSMKHLFVGTLSLWLMTLAAWTSAGPIDLTRLESNTWTKLSPLSGGPVSPRLGYEGSWAYDPRAGVLIHWGGHNQGGGGEQHAETWTFDPRTARWTLREPNDSPPGVCCAQQNVFDLSHQRFIRFPAFSGSHGWQWFREIYLKNSSVWNYDLERNIWRDRRPLPEPRVSPLRCASWDSDHEVVVLFGGEGNSEGTLVYDPYTNTWTNRATPMPPAFRSSGNMTYDARSKRHILFGSQFSNDPHTWAYELRANRWIDLKPAQQPPTDRNDAVLTWDSTNGIVLAVVKITQGKDDDARHHLETWAYDGERNNWTKMNPPAEPDPSGSRARLLTFLPDHGLAILENRTKSLQGTPEQQIWAYRYAQPAAAESPLPAPPTGLRATTTSQGAKLTWKRSGGATQYHIYRGEGRHPWEANFRQIARVPAGSTSFTDEKLEPAAVYHYTVRAVDALGREGPESTKARTQPRVVEDMVVTVLSAASVEVAWTPPEGDDIAGFHVERASVEVWSEDQLPRLKKRATPLPEPSVGAIRRIGPFTRITAQPVKDPRHVDSVDLSKPQIVEGKAIWESRLSKENLDPAGKAYRWGVFAYRIRAVNSLGVESGPSPYGLTIPSAPQQVFSRERGPTCDLKWAANPEKQLTGYRIYRLDGRFDGPPVSRLTPEPITATTFTDTQAGKSARRYHVVAVDALGQEGVPSAPVWFEREWKEFYKPFVGEWHQ